MPFQVTGAAWLAERRRALLCDEMGLGKTCQAIIAADHVAARDVLVIAPAAVCTGWIREFAAWGRMHRPARTVRGPADVDGEGVRVVSYDKARDPATLNALRSRRWDLLVCDEADLLKSDDAQRTQAVLGPMLTEEYGLISCATRAWGLTGTPMPNRADDLWTLLRAFAPQALVRNGVIMSRRSFVRDYCEVKKARVAPKAPLESRVIGLKKEAIPDLRARVRSNILRRMMDDVLPDLPPMRHEDMPLDPGAGAAELAAALADDPDLSALSLRLQVLSLVLDVSDLASEVGQMLQTLSADSISRLRQRTGVVKARVLGPVLAAEMAGSDEKMVVMAWHTEALDSLQDALSPFGAVRLDGQTKPAERQEAIDAFQSDPATRVFLGQILAAGAGITLTAAAEIVLAECSWSPRDNAQAIRRIRRIGQTRPTRARYPSLAGTIDEAVIRTLRRKTQDIQEVIGA